MLRYRLTFEDIEWAKPCINKIDEQEIIFNDKVNELESSQKMIEDYIDYYNNKRLQRKLGVVTPIEKYEMYLQTA